MARRSARPCGSPGCRELSFDGTNRCEKHKRVENKFSDRFRGSAQERGYDWAWKKLRDQIMVRDGGMCQNCLRNGFYQAAYAVDHIKNKASGGTDDPDNLEAICRACHADKTAKEGRNARN